MIDLRSDVVTRAPQEMLKAMSQTPCVNDSDLNDLETLKFQDKIAKLFNKDGAVFFLTASSANLASVLLYTKPGSQIIISSSSHSVERESASFAIIAGVQTRQIFTQSGTFNVEHVKDKIRKSINHVTYPNTDLIYVQNGTFRGRVWNLESLKQLKKTAESSNVKLHIDGARIFNALATYNIQPHEFGDYFDSMTICFTKGLCCPIGAAVIGPKDIVRRLKGIRKSLGGGIFHTGLLTTGAEYAIDNLLPQIKKDNLIAKHLAEQLSKIEQILVKPQEVEINMVYWSVKTANFDHQAFYDHLKSNNLKIKPYDEDTKDYRFVTHNGIREKQVETIVKVISGYFVSLKTQ